MFSESLWQVIKQVITSWQVIVVTVGIIVYLNIVFFTARSNNITNFKTIAKKISFKRKKNNDTSASAGPEEVSSGTGDSNDELGLEEN